LSLTMLEFIGLIPIMRHDVSASVFITYRARFMLLFHDCSIINDASNPKFIIFFHFLNNISSLMKGKLAKQALNPFFDAAVAKSSVM
jgi:hypothetical protein